MLEHTEAKTPDANKRRRKTIILLGDAEKGKTLNRH